MRRVYHRPKPTMEKKFRVNREIRIPEVFLIDENEVNVGIVNTFKALQIAEEAGLDLVEVNPKARPSVVKIMDYGQFKYEKDKQAQKQKVKQKKIEIKGIRLSARISKHDFEFRIDQAKKFLEKGNKLKVELLLKGREKQHPEKAVEIMNNFVGNLRGFADLDFIIEQVLTRQGGKYSILLASKS